jgi:hypothetical protein
MADLSTFRLGKRAVIKLKAGEKWNLYYPTILLKYSLGVYPVVFLKALRKVLLEEKPDNSPMPWRVY